MTHDDDTFPMSETFQGWYWCSCSGILKQDFWHSGKTTTAHNTCQKEKYAYCKLILAQPLKIVTKPSKQNLPLTKPLLWVFSFLSLSDGLLWFL